MKYAFFPGCAHDTSAGYSESLDAVCRKLDIELIEVPDWNCCGATVTAGESKQSSLYLAARSFALAQKEGFSTILTGCNACYTTLRKSARILAKDDGAQLSDANRHLAEEGLELTQSITVRHVMDIIFDQTPRAVWEEHRKNALGAVSIACYYGCQYTRPWLSGLESEQPVYMENFLQGLGFTAVDHSAKTICCGAAGAMPNKSAAQKLVARIAAAAVQKRADAMITICPLCQLNVDTLQDEKKAPEMPVLFFTQLLGLYLDIPEEALGMEKLIISPDTLIRKMQTLKND